MRGWPLLVAVLVLVVVVLGCGSAEGPEPRTPASERDPAAGCGATCDDVNLRGPVAAAALGGDRVAMAARSADGKPLLGTTSVSGGRWDSPSLHLRPVTDAPDRIDTLALASISGGAMLAMGAPGGITIRRVDPDGDTTGWATVAASRPSTLAMAASPDRALAVAWLEEGGVPRLAEIDPEAQAAATTADLSAREVRALSVAWTATGAVVATAGPGGVQLHSGDEVADLSPHPATEVALGSGDDGLVVAWAGDQGVVSLIVRRADAEPDADAVTSIDDGRRRGEPAHRVGAGLSLARAGTVLLVAYQDQTAGNLVLTRSGGVGDGRQVGVSPGFTRAMHVALASVGDRVHVVDLGARTTPEITMSPFVTSALLR